ncbi:MAG: tetratricopeptide repeat protein [Bacteroidia bacterium]|nr:tetratricopeptide repeat protein [Bacteroidia bacterium]
MTTKVEKLFLERQYLEAENMLAEVVRSSPEDLIAIELLGDAYGHQLKWDGAIDCYEKLVKRDPDNADFHYKHGGALGMKALSINKIRALGLIDDIKRAFHSSANLDPMHIDTRWALIELYIQLPGIIGGSKSKALKYAEELQTISMVDGYLAKGYVYEYDNEPELAEMFYKRAIKEGGSITCYEKLSSFYENQKLPELAIGIIETSYRKHNRNALHYQIGKVSADYNVQLDKGERCLKAFIENHTAKDGVPVEWAYYRLAQISKHRQQKEEALRWINKALEIRSDFRQAVRERKAIQQL